MLNREACLYDSLINDPMSHHPHDHNLTNQLSASRLSNKNFKLQFTMNTNGFYYGEEELATFLAAENIGDSNVQEILDNLAFAVKANSPEERDMDMETLVKMVGAYEQDPTKRASQDFHTSITRIAESLRPRCDLILSRMRDLDHAQKNAFEKITIEESQIVYFVALAQSGKTGSIIFAAWKSGILKNMPSIMLSFNRAGETKKFESAANKFNSIVRICATSMGLTPKQIKCVPLIEVFTEKKKSSILYCAAVKRMVSLRTCEDFSEPYCIPFMVVMTNSKKVIAMRSTIRHLSKVVDRDSHGAMKAILIMDEAEMVIKGYKTVKISIGQRKKVPTSLEYEMESPVELCRINEVCGVPGATYITSEKASSIHSAFTSSLRVTATPHAFVYKTMDTYKEKIIVSAEPSRNYWGFCVDDNWGCKTISRRRATCSNDMVDEMVIPGLGNRQGMVMVSSEDESTSRNIAQNEMAKDCAKRAKDRMFAGGFVSIAWDGDGVNVYTTCPLISSFLNTDAGYKSITSVGVRYFKSKKTYPDFMSSMVVFQSENTHVELKTVLYSYGMSGRSTSIKSSCRQLELTDIYVKLSGVGGHDEGVIQAMGRINGVDEREQCMGKFVWGSDSVLDHLYKILAEVPYYIGLIMSGCNITESMDDVTRAAMGERRGGRVDDVYGCCQKTHGKRTRAGICVDAKRSEKKMRVTLKSRKVTPMCSGIPSTNGYMNMQGPVVIDRSDHIVSIASRVIDLLNSVPGRTMSMVQIRDIDPDLGKKIGTGHQREMTQLVNHGILERVRPGVFHLVEEQ